jgi:hypothetical protein
VVVAATAAVVVTAVVAAVAVPAAATVVAATTAASVALTAVVAVPAVVAALAVDAAAIKSLPPASSASAENSFKGLQDSGFEAFLHGGFFYRWSQIAADFAGFLLAFPIYDA